ncbi:MAG: hypothetical protein M2R45_02873 [Verrucomicrobia subdivision 3 bacterium]|nr:hypothetical protein [Limisphaerales bacterium]MCS1414725.1 hypothetical protein [Limisphaerales bacterium]
MFESEAHIIRIRLKHQAQHANQNAQHNSHIARISFTIQHSQRISSRPKRWPVLDHGKTYGSEVATKCEEATSRKDGARASRAASLPSVAKEDGNR